MVKIAIILFRNHMTLEEQHRWWLEDHAPIARRMPGLRGYVINLANREEAGESRRSVVPMNSSSNPGRTPRPLITPPSGSRRGNIRLILGYAKCEYYEWYKKGSWW
jgi:hypothetical protein